MTASTQWLTAIRYTVNRYHYLHCHTRTCQLLQKTCSNSKTALS